MNTKKKVFILFGGRSGEHEVSLVSAASVARNISLDSYEVVLVGIDKTGIWRLQDGSLLTAVRAGGPLNISEGSRLGFLPGQGFAVLSSEDKKPQQIREILRPDIVFPVLHGTFGEDGTIQGLFEMMDIPYVGCTVLGSALGMDKEKVKRVWIQGGLPVVPFKTLERQLYHSEKVQEIWQEAVHQFGSDLFVKPARCGSSVGISKTTDQLSFAKALDLAFQFDTKVLIEPAISAREVEVSVIGNELPRAFVPGEIIPSHGFYDYEAKYQDPDGASFIIPADMVEKELLEAKELAVKAYTLCNACGLSRVDFFLDRKTGALLLNEINTMPGFTSISMFPRMCEADGLPYADLLDELIKLGFKEYERKSKLMFSKM